MDTEIKEEEGSQKQEPIVESFFHVKDEEESQENSIEISLNEQEKMELVQTSEVPSTASRIVVPKVEEIVLEIEDWQKDYLIKESPKKTQKASTPLGRSLTQCSNLAPEPIVPPIQKETLS